MEEMYREMATGRSDFLCPSVDALLDKAGCLNSTMVPNALKMYLEWIKQANIKLPKAPTLI